MSVWLSAMNGPCAGRESVLFPLLLSLVGHAGITSSVCVAWVTSCVSLLGIRQLRVEALESLWPGFKSHIMLLSSET